MSDHLALGVIEAAGSAGLRVPEDLSVVGFDDIPRAGAIEPGLTTIRQPLAERGELAGELLLAALSGRPVAAPLVPVLSTELIVRGSTAPPADRG